MVEEGMHGSAATRVVSTNGRQTGPGLVRHGAVWSIGVNPSHPRSGVYSWHRRRRSSRQGKEPFSDGNLHATGHVPISVGRGSPSGVERSIPLPASDGTPNRSEPEAGQARSCYDQRPRFGGPSDVFWKDGTSGVQQRWSVILKPALAFPAALIRAVGRVLDHAQGSTPDFRGTASEDLYRVLEYVSPRPAGVLPC